MPRKRSVYAAALRLADLPNLEDLLAPFFSAKGQAREHVVMVRLADDGIAHLDELVEAGIFGSRSEAAAFLIGAGIQAQHELFSRISEQASEIKKLRDLLRQTALDTLSAAAEKRAGAAGPVKTKTRSKTPPAAGS
jgi:Arc/MetJ-type ribon-helix-helix transcriptional regulator